MILNFVMSCPVFIFRLCGSNVGNTRRFIAAGNQLHLMFRSEFTVPLSPFTGLPNVQYQLVGFRAQVSTGEIFMFKPGNPCPTTVSSPFCGDASHVMTNYFV